MRDRRALRRLWTAVERRAETATAPALLYAESDLVARALRDLVDLDVAHAIQTEQASLLQLPVRVVYVYLAVQGQVRTHGPRF